MQTDLEEERFISICTMIASNPTLERSTQERNYDVGVIARVAINAGLSAFGIDRWESVTALLVGIENLRERGERMYLERESLRSERIAACRRSHTGFRCVCGWRLYNPVGRDANFRLRIIEETLREAARYATDYRETRAPTWPELRACGWENQYQHFPRRLLGDASRGFSVWLTGAQTLWTDVFRISAREVGSLAACLRLAAQAGVLPPEPRMKMQGERVDVAPTAENAEGRRWTF